MLWDTASAIRLNCWETVVGGELWSNILWVKESVIRRWWQQKLEWRLGERIQGSSAFSNLERSNVNGFWRIRFVDQGLEVERGRGSKLGHISTSFDWKCFERRLWGVRRFSAQRRFRTARWRRGGGKWRVVVGRGCSWAERSPINAKGDDREGGELAIKCGRVHEGYCWDHLCPAGCQVPSAWETRLPHQGTIWINHEPIMLRLCKQWKIVEPLGRKETVFVLEHSLRDQAD